MLKGLLSREVDDFAIALALEFAKRYPVDAAPRERTPLKLAHAVDDVCTRAVEFQRGRKLGVYGRAKLGTAFKMQLRESGYPADFVDELTGKLLISISAVR